MKKKVWLVTKEEYNGFKKRLGFLQRNTNGKYDDLYYDFTMINGSHNSYHRDGSEWGTRPNGKKKKYGDNAPLKDFEGLYHLGFNMFNFMSIYELPNLKSKNIKNDLLYEVDIESFPSSTFNIFVEMIDPKTVIPNTKDMKAPLNAHTIIIKDFEPWIIITILAHNDNLIANFNDGITVKHFNERYSLNGRGKEYEIEQNLVGNKIEWKTVNGEVEIRIKNK